MYCVLFSSYTSLLRQSQSLNQMFIKLRCDSKLKLLKIKYSGRFLSQQFYLCTLFVLDLFIVSYHGYYIYIFF